MKFLDKELLAKNIEVRMADDLATNKVGGAIISVYQNGKSVYYGEFGEEKLGSGIKPNGKTMFRLASMTKPITCTAALILIDRGLLSPDDLVSKYIPEFDNMKLGDVDTDGNIIINGDAETPLKVIHILNHTSGIGSLNLNFLLSNMLDESGAKTLKDAAEFYSKQPLAFEPASANAYSSTAAHDLVARIVEIISGKSFGEFLKEEIFDKLSMSEITFNPTPEQWDRMIYMHSALNGKSFIDYTHEGCVFEKIVPSRECGGAGLAATVNDYIPFAEMLLNKGAYNGGRLFSEETAKLMSTSVISPEVMPGSQRWGYGVRVIVDESYKYLPVGTFGWSGAYGSHFWVDPINNITAIYMKNCRFDGGSGSRTGNNFEIDVYNALSKNPS